MKKKVLYSQYLIRFWEKNYFKKSSFVDFKILRPAIKVKTEFRDLDSSENFLFTFFLGFSHFT